MSASGSNLSFYHPNITSINQELSIPTIDSHTLSFTSNQSLNLLHQQTTTNTSKTPSQHKLQTTPPTNIMSSYSNTPHTTTASRPTSPNASRPSPPTSLKTSRSGIWESLKKPFQGWGMDLLAAKDDLEDEYNFVDCRRRSYYYGLEEEREALEYYERTKRN